MFLCRLLWIEKDSSEEGGLWTRCDQCGAVLYIKHLKEDHYVCSTCHANLQMTSRERFHSLIDPGTWQPFDETVSSIDVLNFQDQKSYLSRLTASQDATNLQDAVITGTGLLEDIPVALGIMDFNFMGGSMGSVVGEKITRLIEYAAHEGLILMLICASGGARMHEGIFSLMQMAKISAALNIYQNHSNLMYISILTSPTTGGVTASFAMLGDIIIGEPNALIGFAGRRVIEQTLQEKLPENFQTAEYLLEHGLLDLIIPREFLKGALYEILDIYKKTPFAHSPKIPNYFSPSLNLLTEEKIRRKPHTQKFFKDLPYLSKKLGLKKLLSYLPEKEKTKLGKRLQRPESFIYNQNQKLFQFLNRSMVLRKKPGNHRSLESRWFGYLAYFFLLFRASSDCFQASQLQPAITKPPRGGTTYYIFIPPGEFESPFPP